MVTSYEGSTSSTRRLGRLALVWLLGVWAAGAVSTALAFENVPDEVGYASLLTRLASRGVVPLDSVASFPLPRNYVQALLERAKAPLSQIEAAHLSVYGRYIDTDGADAIARYEGDGFTLALDAYARGDWRRLDDRRGRASAASVRPVVYGGTSA